jgi:hypothetical protein
VARLRWVVVALAVVEAGWMVFDGTRALVVGDYVTPSSGEYAGRLGPWADLVSAVGIEPRSTGMKVFFVVYGLIWLVAALAFARRVPRSWWAMVLLAAGSLWYLVIGTVASVLQLLVLLVPSVRRGS